MNRFFSYRPALLALAALCALSPVSVDAQETVPFEAIGTFTHQGSFHQFTVGTLTGQTSAGESFTGRYTKWFRGINGNQGTITLEFSDGTITVAYDVTADDGFPKEEYFSGMYVVIGGTGAFASATGYGMLVVQSGGGDFWASGYLAP